MNKKEMEIRSYAHDYRDMAMTEKNLAVCL